VLEYRRSGSALILEISPGRATARWWLVLARVAAASRAAPAASTLTTATGGPGAGPMAAIAYLLVLGLAALAGGAARVAARPTVAGLVAVVALGILVYCVSLRCRAYFAVHRVVLRHDVSASLLDAADRFAERALRAWPDVSSLLAWSDPQPLLEQSLWDLGQLLAALEHSRERLASVDRMLQLNAVGSRLRGELVREHHDAEVLLRHRDRQVARRIAGLRRLAEACDEFGRWHRAGVRSITASPGETSGVEALAAQAEAVVGAYRDLMR
jgi:hypothetical protein